LIAGGILIGLGLLSLLAQLVHVSIVWDFLWPFIVIGIGGLFFIAMFAGGKQAAGFAIPGTIIAGIGLILLFQNLTNYWESWAYGWTVILILVGLGIFISGVWSGSQNQRDAGSRLMKVGLILFIIFGALFELVFFDRFAPGIRQFVFPVLLILLGLFLIINRAGLLGSHSSPSAVQPGDQSQPDNPSGGQS
jgi:hypothetical protein